MATTITAQKKTKKSKPAVPSTLDLVVKAIAQSKEQKGSSTASIKKSLSAMGVDIVTKNTFINKALKRGVETGVLKQVKGVGAVGTFKLDTAKADAEQKAKLQKEKAKVRKAAAIEKEKIKKAAAKAKKEAKKPTKKVVKKAAAKTTSIPKKAVKPKKKTASKKPVKKVTKKVVKKTLKSKK